MAADLAVRKAALKVSWTVESLVVKLADKWVVQTVVMKVEYSVVLTAARMVASSGDNWAATMAVWLVVQKAGTSV